MSDLEDLDGERLNELESILYASIHYNDGSGQQNVDEEHPTPVDDAKSMPPPLQQRQQRIVSEMRVINNASAGKPRYWDKGDKTNSPTVPAIQQTAPPPTPPSAPKQVEVKKDKRMPPPTAAASPKKRPAKKPPQSKEKPTQTPKSPFKAKQVKAEDEPERFDQRLLVAIPPNWPPPGKKEKIGPGPFGKAARKLEQMQRLAAKKQKSKEVQAKKKIAKASVAPVEFIDLKSSEEDDDDDVVHVPLPPVPIIELDTSDGEQTQEAGQPQPPPLEEENAMDAADVEMKTLTCVADAAAQSTTPQPVLSPSSSVMSSDDFIVPKDTSRLIADRARATDEDLQVLTENAIRDAAQEQEAESVLDTSSEYEFVPPSRLEEIKQNYRVDEQQFRALDVYESESDLTESGIYSKVKPKVTPTIIRSIDSASESSDVEEVVESTVNKTKRLRKRRSSSTNQSQSEPNNDDDDDDSEDEAGVQATGVPGIARGMAVERCKRKIRRLSARTNSEEKIKRRQMKTKPDTKEQSSSEESDTEEALPSARDIAERLLQQQQQEQQQHEQNVSQLRPEDNQLETVSIGSDADTEDEAELHDAISDRITAVFERIDAQARRNQEKQLALVNGQCPNETEEEEMTNAKAQEEELAPPDLDPTFETEEIPQEPPIQVEHNLMELTDKEPPRGSDLVGWNKEMCRFYNNSWQGENFSVQDIHRSMSYNRQDWRINNDDRYPVVRLRSNLKCTNCYMKGHVRSKCPNPRKPLVCSTCGKPGHAEPRCPNAICFGCGAKQAIYVPQCNKCTFHSRLVCQLCKVRGHATELCPDKWRRYHSTTRSNVNLDSKVQYKAKQCSYCAGRGHLFENCRQRMGEYRSMNYTSQIMSHQKIYKDSSGPLGYLGDLNSFYDLQTPFYFAWSNLNIPKNCYYAKFLKAVCLAKVERQQVTKRKATLALQASVESKVAAYSQDYKPNPLVKAAHTLEPSSSVTIEELPKEPKGAVQQKDISSNSQTKPPKSNVGHDLDSDSNYSFSEHFELPSSTTNEDTPTASNSLDNLPDVIPLSRTEEDEFNISTQNPGISMCINNNRSLVPARNSSPLPDLPCEGKILMARDQTEYLFTPEGRQFLASAAKQCQVSVRMDFKDYGFVLVIYGLKKHQEDLQLMLLRRQQEVKRKSNEFQSQKPPKRIDVLIRFIRDGLNSLTSHLGNPQNHYWRIKELEEMNTKNGFKMAEKKRRQLNMILLGQAGLLNGNMHLDQLLVILKQLITDFSPEESATPALRNEIEEHWRMIFTAYPHPDYDSLLLSYGKLDLKNRFNTLNIDPVLLGLQMPKRNVVAAPSSPPPPPPTWQHMAPPPPPTIKQQSKNRITNLNKQRSASSPPTQTSNPPRRPQASQMPFNNPQQRGARGNLQLRQTINPECARILAEMDGSSRNSINTDAKKPSMFWSRESFKYLDDLFKMTSNPETVERLNRVLERSRRGQLSHNDYRAVIRLHSLLSN